MVGSVYVREIVIESLGLAPSQPDIHGGIDGSVLTLQATQGCSTSLICAYSSQKFQCGEHSLQLDPTLYAPLAWRGQPSTFPLSIHRHLLECRQRGEKCLQILKTACGCSRRPRQEAAELVLCPLVMEEILLGPLEAVGHGARCWMRKRREGIGAEPALHSARSPTTPAVCMRHSSQGHFARQGGGCSPEAIGHPATTWFRSNACASLERTERGTWISRHLT